VEEKAYEAAMRRSLRLSLEVFGNGIWKISVSQWRFSWEVRDIEGSKHFASVKKFSVFFVY